MSKINFSKVERMLEQGIRRFGVKQLLFLADLSSSFGTGRKTRQSSAFDDIETRTLTLMALEQNLRILRKYDEEIYQKMGISQKELHRGIEHPEDLRDRDWKKIREIQEKISSYRKELRDKIGEISDEDLIRSERKRHINKRFNINDKWLPLH